MIKKLMLALTFASAMGWAQAAVLLAEDFDDVAALPGQGWVFDNQSVPLGIAPGWVQGNPLVFAAQDGAPDSYIASDFNVAGENGVIDNRLFTPLFSLENGARATFWLRAADDPDFSDMVIYGYTEGSTDPLDFIVAMAVTVPTDAWTMYTIEIGPRAGKGRLGFVHTGPQATANYVGLDTLRIDTLREPPAGVPEPASLLIFGLGMAGLAAVRRRR